MTIEKATKIVYALQDDLLAHCRYPSDIKVCAKRFADNNNLKCRDGLPLILHDGSDVAVILDYTDHGQMHIEVMISPSFTVIDLFDGVLFPRYFKEDGCS